MSWQVREADCVEAMREMDEASVDAIVTDPPYGLEFMGKEWDRLGLSEAAPDRERGALDSEGANHPPGGLAESGHPARRTPQLDAVNAGNSRQGGRQRACEDYQKRQARDARSMQEWHQAWATEALRVLKPGGHLLAFGGTRTYHRLACAVEDAGFEIRDSLIWLYGSGFPKSLDVSKAIDKANGKHERDLAPFGRFIREARESKGWTLRQLDEAMGTNTAASWWEGRKSGIQPPGVEMYRRLKKTLGLDDRYDELVEWAEAEREKIGERDVPVGHAFAGPTYGGDSSNQSMDETAPATPEAAQWEGWGTALKPAHEPIVVARKPLSGTVAANVLEHGTGALNIDGCRVDTQGEEWSGNEENAHGDYSGKVFGEFEKQYAKPSNSAGRWPANVVLSEEWEPVLCLWDNLDDDLWEVLAAWCDARNGGVPTVRNRNRRLAQSGEAPKVLLQEMSGGVALGEPNGDGTSDDGAQALRGVEGEDASEPTDQVGAGPPGLEGGLHQPGLSVHKPAGGAVAARAPDSDGAGSGSPLDPGGNRPPHQRDQAGQPPGESRGSRSGGTLTAPRRSVPGAARTPRPCREVLLRDIPPNWLRFFRDTGEVVRLGAAEELDEQSGTLTSNGGKGPHSIQATDARNANRSAYSDYGASEDRVYGDSGGASRFFYCAKASRGERNAGLDGFEEQTAGVGDQRLSGDMNERLHRGEREHVRRQNNHPTVKPIDLMRWLVRLVTPPGGTVLDPFTGSGTTGCAAVLEGFDFLGIEREAEYVEIAKARIEWWEQHQGREAEAVLAESRRSENLRAEHESAGQLGLEL